MKKALIKLPRNGNVSFHTYDESLKYLPVVFSPSLNNRLLKRCFALLDDEILVGGQWDNTFLSLSSRSGELLYSYTNKSIVSCLTLSEDMSILAVGRSDTICLVWDMKTLRTRKPKYIFYGHDLPVTCIFINLNLELFISGSEDKTCILHDLTTGQFTRSISYDAPVMMVKVNNFGIIVTYCEMEKRSFLYVHSINGTLINRVQISGNLSDFIFTECGNYIIHGGDQGTLIARNLIVNPLSIVQDWPCYEHVQCLTLLSKEYYCAGLSDGNIRVIRFNTSQWNSET